jgi:subtilase family serine protease
MEEFMNRRALLAVTAAALLVGISLGTVSAAAASRSTLKGSAPAWANAKNLVGAADPNTVVGFRVYLGWSDQAGAEALARAVSDPKSASYGKYVTPAQFRHQFSPTQAQVGSVQSWLRSQGFTVDYTPANNRYVAAEGTLAQAGVAFGTTFNMYKVHGQVVRSPAGDVSVPTVLGATVETVVGLDESDAFVQMDHVVDAAPSAGFRNSPPLSDYWAQQVSPYAYPTGFTALSSPATAGWTLKGNTPASIKGAYGISGYNGAGQTVAIIDAFASPTILSDVNTWSRRRGLPTMTNGQLTEVVPPGIYQRAPNKKMNPSSWYSEETLDVEAVHGMAPAAKIVFVGAPNNRRDLDAALNHVVDQHLAEIVTNSYGYATELLPPGWRQAVTDIFVQAVAEGIGVYFSSGDFGDETVNFGFATTDFPPSSQWVTAVGGTSMAADQNNVKAIETGWGVSNYSCNTSTHVCTRVKWTGGSGGGVSAIYPEPWYQTDYGLHLTGRGVPDVAAVGDVQTGLLIGQTQVFPDGVYYDEYRIGGTSLSSPLFAGLMALADQKAGHALGFANPLFYANPGAFYDVLSVKTAVARRNFNNSVDGTAGTSDFLRTFDDYSGSPTQHTGTGWDNVTGLGSPNGVFTP